eukprot:scaffold63984_cov61-Cyclotella_meneghiniana.AAC.6
MTRHPASSHKNTTPFIDKRPNAAEAAAITTIHVSIFILHFILPMTILALASNCNDAVLSSIGFSAIIDNASSSIQVQTKPGDPYDECSFGTKGVDTN